VNVAKLIKSIKGKNLFADPPFIQIDDVIEVILAALVTEQNAILYGPGGYGKTEILKWVLGTLNIPYFVISGHSAMSVEDLLGVPDMKKLMEDSELLIQFEKTPFVQEGVLIIEEGTDIPTNVLTALKDIITSKGYRYKDKLIAMNISNIFLTGNTDPDLLELDDSVKAFFTERFPMRIKVEWNSHTFFQYINLWYTLFSADFIKENEKEFHWAAKACSLNSKKVSPRSALNFVYILLTHGISALKFNSTVTVTKNLLEEYNLKRESLVDQAALMHIYKEAVRTQNTEEKLQNLQKLFQSPDYQHEKFNQWINFLKEQYAIIQIQYTGV